jgi:anion-transporting  ArsA/GET3 family ATPase
MTARLHVLLGAGGVGKTTLAAGYALALARSGRRVGLLGIDPSRRLQGALGVELPDLDVDVPLAAGLRAAVLRPEESMRRWAADTIPDASARDRLLANAFFLALSDRLATATDLFAAARVAEWAERDPTLDDLVVDTAPGLDAIEFLRKPQRLTAFLEGSLVAWLRRAGGASPGVVAHGARRILGGLARIGGSKLVVELADLVTLAHDLFLQMLHRVERTQRWLAMPETEILLVTTVREDALYGARRIADALRAENLGPSAVVLNRAVSPEAMQELTALAARPLPPETHPFVRYAASYVAVQRAISESLGELAQRLVLVPTSGGLDGHERADVLARLGDALTR